VAQEVPFPFVEGLEPKSQMELWQDFVAVMKRADDIELAELTQALLMGGC
jgi:hypothetical protein